MSVSAPGTGSVSEFNKRVSKFDTSGTVTPYAEAPDTTEDEMEESIAGAWAKVLDTYNACQQACSALPNGHFVIDSGMSGPYFKKHDLAVDVLINLPDPATERVMKEMDKFWASEHRFRKHGFLWKRGIMLWGPPGSGKTSTVQSLINKVTSNQQNGIAISIYDPNISSEGLTLLRKIEPRRPVLAIIEDIDALIRRYGESSLLSLLDGETQVDNIVYVATTNYPENLDPRFVNRPSRFDLVQKIGMPNANARRSYLLFKHPEFAKNTQTLMQWVKDTEDFSIAHLKELLVAVHVLDCPYAEALDRLKTMMEKQISSKDDENI